jgi:hypothetical protein
VVEKESRKEEVLCIIRIGRASKVAWKDGKKKLFDTHRLCCVQNHLSFLVDLVVGTCTPVGSGRCKRRCTRRTAGLPKPVAHSSTSKDMKATLSLVGAISATNLEGRTCPFTITKEITCISNKLRLLQSPNPDDVLRLSFKHMHLILLESRIC